MCSALKKQILLHQIRVHQIFLRLHLTFFLFYKSLAAVEACRLGLWMLLSRSVMTEGFLHLRDEHANQRVFADFKATLLSSWDNDTAAAWRRRVSVLNKPCIATYKSSEKGAPAQCTYINKRLAGVRREPHRLHQAEVEHAQCKAADHVG